MAKVRQGVLMCLHFASAGTRAGPMHAFTMSTILLAQTVERLSTRRSNSITLRSGVPASCELVEYLGPVSIWAWRLPMNMPIRSGLTHRAPMARKRIRCELSDEKSVYPLKSFIPGPTRLQQHRMRNHEQTI